MYCATLFCDLCNFGSCAIRDLYFGMNLMVSCCLCRKEILLFFVQAELRAFGARDKSAVAVMHFSVV